MVQSKRVGLDVLDEEVRQLISANTKIFPVDYSLIETGLNPNNFEFVRVTSVGPFRNHIFVWDEGWNLIGADDLDVPWGNVTGKPTEFKPISHYHLMADITGLVDELNSIIEAINQKVDKVVGKGLSTNDFTNELRDKLNSLGDSASIDYTEMANRLNTHEENSGIHVSSLEKTAIGTIGQKADKNYVDTELAKKADSTTLSGHSSNATIHVTQTEKNIWNSAEQNAKDYTDQQLENFDSAPEIEIGTTQPTTKIWYKVL